MAKLANVLHANWSGGYLHLWMESGERWGATSTAVRQSPSLNGDAGSTASNLSDTALAAIHHPFASESVTLESVLGVPSATALSALLMLGATTSASQAAAVATVSETRIGAQSTLLLRLPCVDELPLPSATLSRAVGGMARFERPTVTSEVEVQSNAASRAEVAAALGIEGLDIPEVQDLEITFNAEPYPAEEEVESLPEPVPVKASVLTVSVPTFAVEAAFAGDVAIALTQALEDAARYSLQGDGDEAPESTVLPGASLQYFAAAARLVRYLLVQQRFVPSLTQASSGELRGAWQGWMSDEATAKRFDAMVRSCPPSARCSADYFKHNSIAITEDFIHAGVDALVRKTLEREHFSDSIEDRNPALDLHVAWLGGLLSDHNNVTANSAARQELIRRVRGWIGVLEERGASSAWRLLLRLGEPVGLGPNSSPDPNDAAWGVTFHLQSVENPLLVIDGPDVWMISGDSATIMGRRIDRPHELLLGELGRASRFYKRLEEALEESEPTQLALTTKQAYEFLREVRGVLTEQGFGVQAPDWWDSPAARVGAKLHLESDAENPFDITRAGLTNAAKTHLGLSSLVGYKWEIAVGDTTLSLQEFEELAAKRTPLVRVNGRWVEIRPEDVHAAVKFIREHPGGQMKLSDALKMAYSVDLQTAGIPVVGMEATGWLNAFLNSEASSKQLEMIPTPKSFIGTLRPYQSRGVSWMAFQEQLGFGICLADDMGLGKTVQLLALLAWEREVSLPPEPLVPAPEAAPQGSPQDPAVLADPAQPGAGVSTTPSEHVIQRPEPNHSHGVPPTLLLVPMSVVGNWLHETKRFCPHLRVLLHHGPLRLQNDVFIEKAGESDLIVTTYALANRDRDTIARIKWGRIVLDEAQYIKNPLAKQSQAVRSFDAIQRVALTGTPVENRLTELWSIMDFLNPGYLGSSNGFRSKFAVPIERYHDKARGEQLRGLIRPFILRRLKTDPTVVSDLPQKVETKEFSHLTSMQAQMYEQCVKRMLSEVDEAEGMQRRGLVLSTLIKLKQICNHPMQANKGADDASRLIVDPTQSGKCIRMLEMLDEVIAEGDQSLVFTQFREMGKLLESMIAHRFGKDVLFIHGGTTQPQRQAIIERFQRADGTCPVLLLSLRAGGVGLNLTAATHVFHFDRWWNPAVENQATDRAYRIGQTRTVQVHKFIVRGTLEERIDQMIESKTELAENIIGSGEQWISELNTDQLRDILTLRNDAVDDET